MSKALFPIGDLEKSEVRRIAKEQDLITADKKDSQGLCFIGKVHLPEFLQQKLASKKGYIVEIPSNHEKYNLVNTELQNIAKPYTYSDSDGKIVGNHNGAHFFTIGQRKGLGVGGKEEPLFVISTDVIKNIIYVGQGESHPGLARKALLILSDEIHWLRSDLKLKIGESVKYQTRIRYRQPLSEAELICTKEGLYLLFNETQRGIAAGQFAAWYLNDELIGSGVIS